MYLVFAAGVSKSGIVREILLECRGNGPLAFCLLQRRFGREESVDKFEEVFSFQWEEDSGAAKFEEQ